MPDVEDVYAPLRLKNFVLDQEWMVGKFAETRAQRKFGSEARISSEYLDMTE